MFKNITKYIGHNIKSSKAIMILLGVLMLVSGPIPLFMEFSRRLTVLGNRVGLQEYTYSQNIKKFLESSFNLSEEFYSIILCLIAAVAGLVLPYILFYFFRKKNSADFFLSLPVTRTQAYIANFISGIIYYVLPLILTSIVTVTGLSIMGCWDFTTASELLFKTAENDGLFVMLGNNLAFFLLFFAMGTVAVILTSNGINALVVYGTINFYPIVLLFLLLSSAEMFNNDIVDFSQDLAMSVIKITPIVRSLFYEYPLTVFTYIGAILSATVIGCIGCWLCNKRPAESWSSAIVYKPVRLCLQYMYCFIVAFAGGLFLCAVSGRSIANIIVGSILGLVISFMVLNVIFERDVKAIFKKPIRLIYSAVVFVVIFVVIVMDVFGIFLYRKPDADDIDHVYITLNNNAISSNFDTKNDQWLSKLESTQDKQAAIDLYTLLHQKIRQNNHSYLFGRQDSSYNQLSPFEQVVYNHLSLSTSIDIRLMKDGKIIRPLRENYFRKDQSMYELFKTIYDSESYKDPIISVLENATLVYAGVSTISLDRQNTYQEGISWQSKLLEQLRIALIKDYKNSSFDELNDTTPYILELMYNISPAAKSKAAVGTSSVAYDVTTEGINFDFERSMTIAIPSSFVNTLEFLEKNVDMDTLDALSRTKEEEIVKIIVDIYNDSNLVEQKEITDRQEITKILDQRYNYASRTMTFPKYGVVINAFTEEEYTEYQKYTYYEDYKQLAEQNAQVYFLKYCSTLY